MIEVDLSSLNKITVDLAGQPALVDKVAIRAMNLAGKAGARFLVRAVANDMGLTQSDVHDYIRTQLATENGEARVSIYAKTKRLPLADFSARQTRAGVKYKDGVAWKTIQGAFIATMPGGHVGVYLRVPGSKRRGPRPNHSQLPIKERFGPSVGRVFDKFRPDAQLQMMQVFRDNFPPQFEVAKAEGAHA